MLKRSIKRALARAALACLLLGPACSTANRTLVKHVSVESRKSLAAGDFEKALSGFREAARKNPGGTELAANYVRTVEEIKQTADRALRQRDFTRSGRIYRILLDNYADFGTFAAKLTFKKAQLETALKECRIAAVDNPAAQAVKAGNFAKAIDLFHAAHKENPADAELLAKYLGTVNEIKAIADNAFGAEDFARAGMVNVLLLKNFASFEGLEYRKGNLAKAIAVWEGLLSFDPDNAEIKKAVNTAKTQLAGIKK
jgi:tetratricopeptide (TPR) repeat protein